MNPDTLEEPQAGGSYIRNADGSLTLVERTGHQPEVPAEAPADSEPPAVVAGD